MREGLTFGVSLSPTTDVAANRALARAADDGGPDLIGLQDHPYVPDYADTFVLAGDLLAHTRRISVFPDVANLPLRPPAMLAQAAAALDLVSDGRFELALGAGGYWDAITRLGVPRRSPAEANAALEEAITVLRGLWAAGGPPLRLAGEHYTVSGVRPGPAPAHPIEIWTGAQGPKALALTGRVADGWAAPIVSYLPYEKWADANRLVDEAATAAGRAPARSAASPRSSARSPTPPAPCAPTRATTRSTAARNSGPRSSPVSAPNSPSPASCSGPRTRPPTRSPPSPATSRPRSAAASLPDPRAPVSGRARSSDGRRSWSGRGAARWCSPGTGARVRRGHRSAVCRPASRRWWRPRSW